MPWATIFLKIGDALGFRCACAGLPWVSFLKNEAHGAGRPCSACCLASIGAFEHGGQLDIAEQNVFRRSRPAGRSSFGELILNLLFAHEFARVGVEGRWRCGRKWRREWRATQRGFDDFFGVVRAGLFW